MQKTGERAVETKALIPLASNNSVSTNMLTRYGKTLVANGRADFAPKVKESYGLTFFISAKKKMIKKRIGIKYLDMFIVVF